MELLLGIDLGTSSVKAVLFDANSARVIVSAAREYAIHKPTPDRAEQDPDDWWRAAVEAIRAALDRAATRDVRAIGLCGQMHGVTLVDGAGAPLHPSIIWADQRSAAETRDLIALFGADRYTAIAGTLPAVGFMAPTLLWLKRHNPVLLDRAHAVLLPKDYVRAKLTGQIATDHSDAAATGLYDIRARAWSNAIIDAAGLPRELFPLALESSAQAGELTASAAAELGLTAGIPIATGCADQPAQALANNLIAPGRASITVGSGGQVFMPVLPNDHDTLPTDPRVHVFNHAAPQVWYVLGATLSAGLSLRWLRHLFGQDDLGGAAYKQFSAAAESIAAGSDGLIFLPYLTGERTPHMDAAARGAFIGLSAHHEQAHLARAVMEGVAFSLRQTFDVCAALTGGADDVIAVGGGMSSPLWRGIMADVLDRALRMSTLDEHTGIGAALLGGIAAGVYDSCAQAGAAVAQFGTLTEPNAENAARYATLYDQFVGLYPRLRDDFRVLGGEA